MLQLFIHYFLHLIFPALVAFLFFRKDWKKIYLIFLLTMLVDLDHMFASPVFSPCRCSIGFHPMHSEIAIIAYALMLVHPKLRPVAVGLLMHMATDYVDCIFSRYNCA